MRSLARISEAALPLMLFACCGGPPAPAARAPVDVKTTLPRCDDLAVIRFSEFLCDNLARDDKRITLRARHRKHIAVGQWVQLVCMDSRRRFLARVTGVRHTTWRGVTDQEIADDGFPGRAQLLPIMRRFYPGIGLDDLATVYRWDRSRRCP